MFQQNLKKKKKLKTHVVCGQTDFFFFFVMFASSSSSSFSHETRSPSTHRNTIKLSQFKTITIDFFGKKRKFFFYFSLMTTSTTTTTNEQTNQQKETRNEITKKKTIVNSLNSLFQYWKKWKNPATTTKNWNFEFFSKKKILWILWFHITIWKNF